jgi:hypothetical protein
MNKYKKLTREEAKQWFALGLPVESRHRALLWPTFQIDSTWTLIASRDSPEAILKANAKEFKDYYRIALE